MANARRLGTAAGMITRTSLSGRILRAPTGRGIETAQYLNEPVRHPLIYDLVIHEPQLVPDFGFDLGPEISHDLQIELPIHLCGTL